MVKPLSHPICPIERAVANLLIKTGKRPLTLAFSGGMDSTVLLHELVKQNALVFAVHVHHGLQAVADEWVKHCQTQAQQRNVVFRVCYVQVSEKNRRGLEDKAREARYEALWEQVGSSGVLLTAHHQRDQAETFLLRAMRGAGVVGLSSIKAWQEREDKRSFVRPLLSVAYLDMQAYAIRKNLSWIEDPTNNDDFAMRNRVRYQLLPLMNQLYPQCETQLANAAAHLQEAQQLLNIVADEDWQKISINRYQWRMDAWRALPWIRAKHVLMKIWHDRTASRLSLVQWQQIEQQLYMTIREGSHARFCYQGWCLLSEGAWGYCLPEEALSVPNEILQWHNGIGIQAWGNLACLSRVNDDTVFDVKPRKGGETIKTAQGTRTLKKWLQKQPLSAWQKAHWPVIYDAKTNSLLGWANMPDTWWQTDSTQVTLAWFPLEEGHQGQ